MKRFLLALALIPLMASADRVDAERAALATRGWLARHGHRGRLAREDAVRLSGKCAADGEGSFRVHGLAGGGFVVTSDDTEIEPVIAFSDTGSPTVDDGSPLWDILRADMAARKAHLKARRVSRGKDGWEAKSNAIRGRWSDLVSASATSALDLASSPNPSVADVRVDALLQTEWAQQDYENYGLTAADKVCYNFYTPNNWPCGCVATAGAQVMRYFRHPSDSVTPGTYDCQKEIGKQWVDQYTYIPIFEDISLTMKGGNYDWGNMPLKPSAGCTEEQRRAIGKLTYDIGVSVRMGYAEGGSSASMCLLAKRLVDRFGYVNAACAMFKTGFYFGGEFGYTQDRLKRAVVPNLDGRLPTILSLSGDAGGHVVVADGYGYSGKTFYIHINLGWANLNNGNAWYQPPDIDDFDVIDGVIYNIYPDEGKDESIVSGRVLDASSKPVPGAQVTVKSGGTVLGTVKTDAKGIYSARLPAGTYVFESSYSDCSVSRTVNLKACVSIHSDDNGHYWSDVLPQINNLYDQDLGQSGSLTPDPDPEPEPEPEPMPEPSQKTSVSVVPPSRPFVAPAQKITIPGAVLAKDGSVAGVVQLNLGKASKAGVSKVSVTLIGLDGKKMSSKAVLISSGTVFKRITFDVKGYGPLTLTLGADGFIGETADTTVVSVRNEPVTGEAAATFVPAKGFAVDNMLGKYLPKDVRVQRTAKKWTPPKAGKLKYDKKSGTIVETGDNIAGLKLTYNAKAGTLKGSFEIWTFDAANQKLKSVSASVTGVVVDGIGYGEVSVKKLKIGEMIVK